MRDDEIAEDGFVTAKRVRKKSDRFEHGRNRDLLVMAAELTLRSGGGVRPPHAATLELPCTAGSASNQQTSAA